MIIQHIDVSIYDCIARAARYIEYVYFKQNNDAFIGRKLFEWIVEARFQLML